MVLSAHVAFCALLPAMARHWKGHGEVLREETDRDVGTVSGTSLSSTATAVLSALGECQRQRDDNKNKISDF